MFFRGELGTLVLSVLLAATVPAAQLPFVVDVGEIPLLLVRIFLILVILLFVAAFPTVSAPRTITACFTALIPPASAGGIY